MSIGLFFNQIKSLYYGFVGWFVPTIFGAGVYIFDFKHYPQYQIYIDQPIPTDRQLYVEDIQLDVKYIRDSNGAILGYIGDDGLIDYTNYVAHVTLEGTIILWTRDDDPYGLATIIVPMNCQLQHILIDGKDLEVVPQPPSAQKFTSTDVRWQPTTVPGHWTISSPITSIDVKWNRSDRYGYVDTTYHLRKVSRYDDKWFLPKFIANGVEIDGYRSRPPQITSAEFDNQLNLASLYVSWVKHKFDHEPLTLNNFRRSAVLD